MIFLDASVFLAYDNADDVHHDQAAKIFQAVEKGSFGQHFTSDYVFNEVVGVTYRKIGKERALALGNHLLKNSLLITIDEHLLKKAWHYFEESASNFNLVDCTSVVLMKQLKAQFIATFDKEFHKEEVKVICEIE